MDKPLRTVALSIAVVFVVVVIGIAVTNFVQFMVDWFTELDDIVSAEFFATLTGLSLAAASFLSGTVSDLQNQVLTSKRVVDQRRIDAADAEERIEAERWFLEQSEVSEDSIRSKNYTSSVEQFLVACVQKRQADEKLSNLTQSKNAIIWSFFCFFFGLIETITLDIWSKISSRRVGEADGWFSSLIGNIDATFGTIVDVVLSGGLLIAGLYFLAYGARGLLSIKT